MTLLRHQMENHKFGYVYFDNGPGELVGKMGWNPCQNLLPQTIVLIFGYLKKVANKVFRNDNRHDVIENMNGVSLDFGTFLEGTPTHFPYQFSRPIYIIFSA